MGDLTDFLSKSEEAPPSPEGEGTPTPAATPEAPGLPGLPAMEGEAPNPEGEKPEGEKSEVDRRNEAIWREERQRRKELQAQVEQMNARWQEMISRMQQPGQQGQQGQPEMPEIPPYDQDPLGHLKAQNDLLAKELAEARAFQSQQTVQAQKLAQFQQFKASVDQMESSFAEQNPDYSEALGFLYENVRKMSKAMGYPPEAEQRILSQTALDLTVRALHQGVNPAQAAYEAAKNIGWQPGAGGGRPAPAPRPTAPTSLGGVAGKPPAGGTPTWDAIAKMSAEEFDTWWKQFERQQRGR